MVAISLILGLVILIFGAELLVRGAASLAKRLAIAEIVIGLTVVAFGTSTPEMVVNIFASIENRNDIVFGNIIGSNIFNILLILGISGLIYPLTVQKSTVWKEIPFSFLVTIALLLLVNDSVNNSLPGCMLSRNDGLILLLLFAIFITYLFGIARVESPDKYQVKVYSVAISILLIIGGLGALFAGGKLCLVGAVGLARNFGLSEKFIASTIIAAGTSLPELATSSVAAYRRRCDIAVGNIVGSNIFNILLILGVSAVVHPARYNPAFNVDLSILIVATVILYIVMFTGKKHRLDRWEAGLMLLGYVSYVMYLFYLK
ncbi:MAG: calcium/sodium antiporter [Sedimentisphaerales bacterium]|nr:calcium/sodium antiporter [Sedimentisphaerales bacterium]